MRTTRIQAARSPCAPPALLSTAPNGGLVTRPCANIGETRSALRVSPAPDPLRGNMMRKVVAALLLSCAAVLVAAPVIVLLAFVALAQSWPTRPIRVIVPFAAGSATDIVPRTVFEQVSAQVGQSIIIDNRPGGGTTIGTGAVAKADPDGYTILVHSNGFVTTPAIQANVPYDPVRDFAGVTPVGSLPMVLVISPDKTIRTVKDLVASAKARPGAINYAAAGIGTPPHLTTERFRLAAGFQGQLVPFKGAPEALTEVVAGRV